MYVNFVVSSPPVASAVFGQENVGDSVLAWLWPVKILHSKGSLTK